MMNNLSIKIESASANTTTKTQFTLSVDESLNFEGIIGIFGHSGAGKTSLLRAISGLSTTFNGEITLNQTVLFSSQRKINVLPENRNISMVFQEPRLFPHLTVEQNLAFARKRRKGNALSTDLIVKLTGIRPLLHKNITQLSGGEQQKVSIARAILSEPNLLLLDEPFSALDRKSKQELILVLEKLREQLNLPMVYVSHSSEELQLLAEQLLVLEHGNVKYFGNVHHVFNQLNETHLIKKQTSLSLHIDESDELNSHIEKYGLIALTLGKMPLYMSVNPKNANMFTNSTRQKKIRCYIFADDISISTIEPTTSSIVNKIPANIEKISQENGQVLISLNAQGQVFFASISAYSLEKLSLKLKQQVYMQFKASALRTLTINH